MTALKIEDVQERAEELKELWGPRNTAILHNRDLFFLNHYPARDQSGGAVDTPNNSGGVSIGSAGVSFSGRKSTIDSNGAYRVTSSEYTDFTLSLRSMVMAQQPIIRCFTDKETRVGDERSQNAEKILQAIRYVNRMRQERDYIDDAVHDLFSCGWTVLYSYFDEDLERTYKDTGDWRDFPVVVKCLPAEHCYPKPGGKRGRWREVIYSWPREIAEIEDEFNVRLTRSRSANKKDGKDSDDEEVDFYDYWWWEKDKVWHCIVAGEDWVKKPVDASNWYKSLAYTICNAISTPSPDPAQMGLSPYMAMEPNVELQEDLTSRIMTGITYHADPTILALDGQGLPIAIDKDAGGIVHLKEGQDVRVLEGPTVSQDVYQMLNHVSGAVQRSGLPSISYGMGLSGLSGYAISLMGQGGQMKMVLPVANLETALSIVMDKTLDILRNFYEDKPINAYGQDRFGKMFSVKMTGDDLKGLRVDVKLKPRIPQDEVARANRARLLDGLVSRMYIKDNVLELQDPVGDNRRQLVEQFLQNPLIMSAEMARAADAMGVDAGDIQAFMQSMMPRQTAGPPQGPPGAGNPAAPPQPPGAGMAPASPDELAQMQMMAAAQGQMPGPEGAGSAGMSMGGQMGGGY